MISGIGELLKNNVRPLAIVLLAAFLLWGFSHWRYTSGRADERLVWSQKWSERDADDAKATAQREARERAEEQRRQLAANEEQKRADKELAKVQADADAAERAAGGLRSQLTAIQRQLAGSETGRLSAVAAAGAAKAQAGILLTQLLGEADDLAGKFAKEADERYVAGSTCERTYDKVTNQPALR